MNVGKVAIADATRTVAASISLIGEASDEAGGSTRTGGVQSRSS